MILFSPLRRETLPVRATHFSGIKNSIEFLKTLGKTTASINLSAALNKLRSEVKNVISKGNYDWKVSRITTEGKMYFE